MSDSTLRKWQIAAIIVMAVIALVLRAVGIGNQSLTGDELYDIGISQQPALAVVTAQDRFPPIYHLTLHGWLALFQDPATGRWLSVLYGLASIPFVAGVARQIAGTRAAWWTAALLVISPLHCYYSQEVRAYSLFFLFAAITVYSFVRSVYGTQPVWWLLVCASVAGIYTHYYFPLVLCALAIALCLDDLRRVPWRPLLLTVAAVFVFALPALYLLKKDLDYPWGHSSESAFDSAALGYTYFTFLGGQSLGPSTRQLHELSTRDAIRQFIPWIICLLPLALLLVASGHRALRKSSYWGLLVVLAVLPVVVIGGLSAAGAFGYNIRHTYWALIPIVVWLGIGLANLRWTSATVVFTPLLLVSSIAILQRGYDDRYRNEDARSAAGYMQAAVEEGDSKTAFVISNYMEHPLRYYLNKDWQVIPIPDVDAGGNGLEEARAEIIKKLGSARHFWLVYTRAFHGDPGGWALRALAANEGSPQAAFAGIRLYHCDGQKLRRFSSDENTRRE